MLLIISALAFFFLITGLILIHEFGHFIAARKLGVVVEEFGFGLPPRAKKFFTWQGTEFTLNWIPFGGFVRLKGENEEEGSSKKPKGSFSHTSILKRCIILIAGVTMNFLLAMLIFLFGFSYGQWIPTYLTLDEMEQASARGDIHLKLGVVIDDVLSGGGAEDAKIPKGSVLTSIDGKAVTHPADVVSYQAGKTSVSYVYVPAGETAEKTVRVRVDAGKTGLYLRSVPLELSAPKRNIIDAAALSVRETGVVTTQTVLGIVRLFGSLAQSGQVPAGVTGIIGIAQLTYTSVQEGFIVYLRLVALLSLSLAVLNILPFPALDGGRMLFVLSEIFVKPGNRRVEAITNAIGFVVLLLLILIVTLFDVFRLFH